MRDLSDDVVQYIISYLPSFDMIKSLSRVSKTMLRHTSMVRSFKFREELRDRITIHNNHELVQFVAKRLGNLEELSIYLASFSCCNAQTIRRMIKSATSNHFKSLWMMKNGIEEFEMDYVPTLERLDLRMNSNLKKIIIRENKHDTRKGVPVILKLNGCHKFNTDSAIDMIQQSSVRFLENLSEIHLDGCQIDDLGVMMLISVKNFNLKILSLFCCPITDHAVQLIAASYPKLHTLNISGCNITDASLESIAKSKCSKLLKVIDLSQCKNITSMGIVSLSKSCINLNDLILNGCKKVGDQALFSIRESMRNLHNLDLSFCNISNDAIHGILFDLEMLHSLFISYCPKVQGAFDIIAPNHNHSYLRVLDLSFQPKITDQSVKNLLHSLQDLRILNLSGCRLISDSSFENCRCDLQEINLSQTNISNLGLKHISDHCPNLRTLYLLGNNVSDDGICYILQNCKYLEELGVQKCKYISDLAMQYIASSNLKKVSLSRTSLTDSGLFTLAKADSSDCNGLRHLVVSGCKVSLHMVDYVKQCRMGLNIIF